MPLGRPLAACVARRPSLLSRVDSTSITKQASCLAVRQTARSSRPCGCACATVLCLRNSSSSSSSSSSSINRGSNSFARPKRIPSIYEELFPGEVRETELDDAGTGGATGSSRPKEVEDEASIRAQAQSIQNTAEAASALGTGDIVRQWLNSPAKEGEGEKENGTARTTTATSVPRRRGTGPTVLILSGASTSLLPSDFFRIAPPATAAAAAATAAETGPPSSSSAHMDGWAAAGGGLYKVVQDRDPVTLAPRGRYFLCFGAPAAALAYAQEVRELHRLARRAVQPRPHRKAAERFRQESGFRGSGGGANGGSGGGSGSAGERRVFVPWRGWRVVAEPPPPPPPPALADEDGDAGGSSVAALRQFTLLPPTAKLDLAMEMPDIRELGGTELRQESNTTDSDVSSCPPPWDDDADTADAAAATATTKVLVVLEDVSGRGSTPPTTTVAGLRRLMEADGAARNLPWAVSDGLNGVVPVPWLVAEQARLRRQADDEKRPRRDRLTAGVPDLRTKTDQMNEQATFSRFVVAFADVVEARRFVRGWHRRRVAVPTAAQAAAAEAAEAGTTPEASKNWPNRMAVVDTTVLW